MGDGAAENGVAFSNRGQKRHRCGLGLRPGRGVATSIRGQQGRLPGKGQHFNRFWIIPKSPIMFQVNMGGHTIMKVKVHWKVNVLEKLQDTSLFYPCSGNDLLVPIEVFSPYVTDFWFVDRGYFSPYHQDTRFNGRDVPADEMKPILMDDARYEFLEKDIAGPPSWDWRKRDITPCVLTETYRHVETGRTIRVRLRRGYGFSAFRKERIKNLGVFFYRGDSHGEGGSSNQWLKEEHLDDVLRKLEKGGVLAIDGRDGAPYLRKKGIYTELCKFAKGYNKMTPEEALASMNVVADKKLREFFCVGCIAGKYIPTMIWRIREPRHRRRGAFEDL